MGRKCEFCCGGEGAYTCPRCNKDYCGLRCYQSVNHSKCSENFYKECVQAELSGDNLSQESKHRMEKILARIASESTDSDSEEDSDDDSDEEDLADRLQAVDLDDADSVWEKLSARERKEFTEFLEKGDVNTILPTFNPWWSQHIQEPKIQEVDAPVNKSFMKICPPLWNKIPDFNALFARGSPSPTIKYGVMNLVYAYAYAVRLLHGDYENNSIEFINIVELLVGTDGCLAGREFDLADTAVETAASRVSLHPEIAVSTEFSRQVKQDVYKVIKGPTAEHGSYYLLSCLSDLRTHYLSSVQQIKSSKPQKSSKIAMFCEKAPDLDVKVLKVHVKKIEFYLSWAVQNHVKEYQLL